MAHVREEKICVLVLQCVFPSFMEQSKGVKGSFRDFLLHCTGSNVSKIHYLKAALGPGDLRDVGGGNSGETREQKRRRDSGWKLKVESF